MMGWYLMGLVVAFLFMREAHDHWQYNQKVTAISFGVVAIGIVARCGYQLGMML